MSRKRRDPPAALIAFSARADEALARALPLEAQEPVPLHQAMRYAVLGGGKRLRPVLVYATGHALGASLDTLDAAACAVEIVHAYSLVHDDLPAMDDDELRRGRPTCHVAFGEAMAILAGDALQALAFEILAADTAHHAGTRVEMLRTLAAACGSHGMAGGQALDLAAVGVALTADELDRMHEHKTGALIRASVRLGALAAGCSDQSVLAALDRYGNAIGLAFQIRDDILDVEGDSDVIGKTAGKDAANAKPTYPAILGMDASRARLAQLTHDAINALASLGDRAQELAELASYVAERES
ncbi:MAG: (2E,6E)-farnesyl diphosphate synthase [Xanthomonadales bacterium PRO7]|nr:(2E,6E)-farnesyl diphosphate synthase [Xanthomonadales bacterium PRO7]